VSHQAKEGGVALETLVFGCRDGCGSNDNLGCGRNFSHSGFG
jgi:hypothetical protein